MPERPEVPAMLVGVCSRVCVLALVACAAYAGDVSTDVSGRAAIDATQWSALCLERAGIFQSFSDDECESLRRQLQAGLDKLQRKFPWVARDGQPWHEYLLWEEIRRLASGAPLDEHSLDVLEMRWLNAPRVWEASELVAVADVALQCVRVRRSAARQETPEQQAGAWSRLGELLREPANLTATERQAVAEVLWDRERLGQASPLTASVRSVLSRPNLVVQVRTAWFESQHAVKIDEPFSTRGLFAGADTVSNGRLTGSTGCRLAPSAAGVEWILNFQGQSVSSSVSYSQGAQVNSRATTTVSGEKHFRMSAVGMASDPADATASTVLTYGRISTAGLGIRRRIAEQRAAERRPAAERDTSDSVRNSVRTQLDDIGREAAESFNRSYVAFRNRFANAARMVPRTRIRLDDEWLFWEGCLEGWGGFAASQEAPLFEVTAPLVVHVAADAMEEYAVVVLGKKRLSQEELAETIGEAFGEDKNTPPPGESFEVEFAPRPAQVRLQNGHVLVSLFISAFESGDTSFPAMTVEVDYAFRMGDEGVALVREGKLKVKPLPVDDGEGGKRVTGRQQTLCLVAQRKLSRILGEEFLWSGPAVSVGNTRDNLQISKLRAEDGWLQFALTPN